ncbi:hypothetical protein PR048_014296 [Dryococelus australis]|uniref:Uncharacterized protein n=1 Tax=Dryococelus australis TaxID=614101 RepID=A0ABQ9HDY9_9NEOP|nr:hypothetical protein PR048_014296 [Dryococelus australis]
MFLTRCFKGVVFSDGPFWVEQRRFALRHLRDFGFGKTSMDNIMHEEVQELFKVLEASEIHPDGPVPFAFVICNLLFTQISRMFNQSIVNLLWTIVSGQRFSYDDEKFQEILTYVYKSFRLDVPGGILVNVFPFLRFIIPKWSGYEEAMEYVHGLQGMLRHPWSPKIAPRLGSQSSVTRALNATSLCRLIGEAECLFPAVAEEGLIVLCMDLFIAGSDTVSNTLEFCLLYMVLYQEVQRKVQEELDSVLGPECMPSAGDRTRLTYSEAVLAEVTRINNIVPIPPPHRCMKPTKLKGYIIPEDTIIFVNLWALLHDKEHWGDPEVFRPERFLDSEGKFVKDEWYNVFGLGKRTCLGESLARNALFVFFTSMLQRFHFSLPEGEPTPPTKGRPGLTSTPEPFRIRITRRSS